MTQDIPDILRKIAAQRRTRLDEARAKEDLPAPARGAGLVSRKENAFLSRISEKRGRAVIAEIKMGSPRIGRIDDRVNPLVQAKLYATHGAAAISVVVEPDFFYGSYELLDACRFVSGLPVLAKDFVVDPLQIAWAQRAGASAVLLVAALYTQEQLVKYAALARRYGLVPLVEIHDLKDIMKLEGTPWELVGVNNRDLRTFEVEIGQSMALLPSLPTAALKVAESGIREAGEIEMLRSAGFDAFLIGESLLLAEDPAAKLRELV